MLAVPLFGFMAISSEQLITLIWGSRYEDAGGVLRVLLIAIMLTSCAFPCVTRLSATTTRSLASATRVSIVGVLVAGMSWFPLGAGLGIQGVAWGYLAGAAITASTLMVVCWRTDGQPWFDLLFLTFVGAGCLVAVAAVEPSWTRSGTFAIGIAFAFMYGLTALYVNRHLMPVAKVLRRSIP